MYLLTPGWESMIDRSIETTKVQRGEPVSFIGISNKNMGKGSLTETEMIQRQLCHQSLPKHGCQFTKIET